VDAFGAQNGRLKMIKTETLLVLGAGASKPYGFPTGIQLREEIINKLLEYFENKEELKTLSRYELMKRKAEEFIHIFKESSIESIDLFLSRNREYEDIGKIAIAICILVHEESSNFNEDVKEGDWYRLLYKKLTDDLINSDEYSRVNSNLLSIITFNYDRSLEYYFNNSLYNSFSDLRKDINTMDYFKIPIYHVYGSIGDFKNIPYGLAKSDRYYPIEYYTKNLKTIYQERSLNDQKINMIIDNAKRVIFLGFSYLKENLFILQSTKWNKDKELYGTTVGISRKEEIDFKQMFNQEIKFQRFEPIDSHNLLKEII